MCAFLKEKAPMCQVIIDSTLIHKHTPDKIYCLLNFYGIIKRRWIFRYKAIFQIQFNLCDKGFILKSIDYPGEFSNLKLSIVPGFAKEFLWDLFKRNLMYRTNENGEKF